jgi:hypothetical protein
MGKGLGVSGLSQNLQRFRDLIRPSLRIESELRGSLAGFFVLPSADILKAELRELEHMLRSSMLHEFNLLGSGPVKVEYGLKANGFLDHVYPPEPAGPSSLKERREWLNRKINLANRTPANQVRALISDTYCEIDWQLDFKTGYRWSESKWALNISSEHPPGVDVRVPLELSRQQHLIWLSYGYQVALRDGQCAGFTPEQISQEFADQILDFISSNPPCFGVNWHCPMNAAIRVANWLVAFDLFRSAGWQPDQRFLEIMKPSLLAHGDFIFKNLKRSKDFRGNSYLAGVAGLLYIAVYLPASAQADQWLEFAGISLLAEGERQFFSDGTSFEGSTAHHCLSAEIFLYAVLLWHGVSHERGKTLQAVPQQLSTAIWQRLQGMANFIKAVQKPDNQIVQIGDCGSGHFFKLQPAWRKSENGLVEDHLDQRHLLGAFSALLKAGAPSNEGGALETLLVKSLLERLGDRSKTDSIADLSSSKVDSVGDELEWQTEQWHSSNRREYRIPLTAENQNAAFERIAFPEFGIYIFRGAQFFLSIRCGPIGQMGRGGHDHCDQLAIELQQNQRNWILDPGTYLESVAPKMRNRYRSVFAHFAPQIKGHEPADLQADLFRLEQASPGRCVFFGPRKFLGVHEGFGQLMVRSVEINNSEIIIVDSFEGIEKLLELKWSANDPLSWCPGIRYSPGYGEES